MRPTFKPPTTSFTIYSFSLLLASFFFFVLLQRQKDTEKTPLRNRRRGKKETKEKGEEIFATKESCKKRGLCDRNLRMLHPWRFSFLYPFFGTISVYLSHFSSPFSSTLLCSSVDSSWDSLVAAEFAPVSFRKDQSAMEVEQFFTSKWLDSIEDFFLNISIFYNCRIFFQYLPLK